MAPRPISSATVSFGLVSIPVKLFTTAQQVDGVSFRMLHGKCRTPVKQQYVCPVDGEKVERDEIVKGYEFAKDQYVLFTPEEIKALEEEATNAIIIEEFVPLADIDPLYYDRAYYLAPDKGGERAYRLLSRALTETALGGMARYAARGKQYVVIVRPVENGLLMQQLRYAEEVRPFSEVPVGNGGEVKDAELNLALQLVRQSASDGFHPEKYVDETLARFQEIVRQKVDGEQTIIARGEAPPAKVIDLMEALKASLAKNAGGGEAAGEPEESAGGAERKSRPKPVRSDSTKETDEAPAPAARRPAKAAPKRSTQASQESAAPGRRMRGRG